MKIGSIFDAYDIDRFEQWKREREAALSEVVIKTFCKTANNPDHAAELVHGFVKELLLAAGHSEEGLEALELLSQGEQHHES